MGRSRPILALTLMLVLAGCTSETGSSADCDELWARREAAQAAAELEADGAETAVSEGGSTITEAETAAIREHHDEIAAATDALEAAGCL